MKKLLFPLLTILSLILYNCNNSPGSTGEADESTQGDTSFYPIGSFILSQLNGLDSLPLAVIKYTTANQTTDTSIVEKTDFKAVASAFTTPDIGSPELKSWYVENTFIDATLGTISLTYTSTRSNTEIKRADILLNQETREVKTIYIEKSIEGKDSTVVQKMLWTANRNCQITTIVQKPNQSEAVVSDRYVWDNMN